MNKEFGNNFTLCVHTFHVLILPEWCFTRVGTLVGTLVLCLIMTMRFSERVRGD